MPFGFCTIIGLTSPEEKTRGDNMNKQRSVAQHDRSLVLCFPKLNSVACYSEHNREMLMIIFERLSN